MLNAFTFISFLTVNLSCTIINIKFNSGIFSYNINPTALAISRSLIGKYKTYFPYLKLFIQKLCRKSLDLLFVLYFN